MGVTERIGLLVPVTTRGTNAKEICSSLENFARSIQNTLLEIELGRNIEFYVGIDDDDTDIRIIQDDITKIFCSIGTPKQHVKIHLFNKEKDKIPKDGSVCHYWNILGCKAFENGCDFVVLFGDDVVLKSENWLEKIIQGFKEIERRCKVPFGFGVVSFNDLTHPYFPTFPVLGKHHYKIFGDRKNSQGLFPSAFINQDADPYLWQLYRRMGDAREYLHDATLENRRGGAEDDTRYEKERVPEFFWLIHGTASDVDRCAKYLAKEGYQEAAKQIRKFVTLDVIVPSMRVDEGFIKPLVEDALSSNTAGASIEFILLIDRPGTLDAQIKYFLEKAQGKYQCRFRCRQNSNCLGAGGTRNRGLEESSSQWVLFLDDDITIPPSTSEHGLVNAYVKAITAHNDAAGFVGLSSFPPAAGTRQQAMHLSGAAFFWGIASILKHPPWGVTANLVLRRAPGVYFPTDIYPKSGGGEDIDLCIQTQDYFVGKQLHSVPQAEIVHPYWGNGCIPLSRFSNWAFGDGMLNERFPKWTYKSAPNLAEIMLITLPLSFTFTQSVGFSLTRSIVSSILTPLALHIVDFAYNIVFWNQHPLRVVLFTTLIHTGQNWGRMQGHRANGVFLRNIGTRFNWWGPEHQDKIQDEKNRYFQRASVLGAAYVILLALQLKL
uniref:Glycosyltransferase 2-like domain-containing protein n=1 Tax=Mucochytrium quahogii TaxID=96639 RepID=A0A7S2W5J2_9STRA|mmetsp:Transcript_5483/g.8488  ORF Transcript_5483/g.8488 Transcript_5483/m.8488 type:complete len:661 (+) Transcript_5483:84-2066(+)